MSDQNPKQQSDEKSLPPITLKTMKRVVDDIAADIEDDQARIAEIWTQKLNPIECEKARVLRKVGELIDRVSVAIKSNDRVRKALGFRAPRAEQEVRSNESDGG